MDGDQQRLLATMPLHAITSTYGEAGLRDRFAVEIASWAEGDRLRMERALDLAARLHADDRRDREPYVNHLLRVAIRIMSHYGVRDADVVCAALLHDAVEDHPAELTGGRDGQPAALAVLADQFGPRVAELVGAVTNPPYAPGRDQDEQYREHVADSLRDNPWARIIKASDFTDNGCTGWRASTRHWSRCCGSSSPGRIRRWTPRPRSTSWLSSTGPPTGSRRCAGTRPPGMSIRCRSCPRSRPLAA
jgi:hypothetical protein